MRRIVLLLSIIAALPAAAQQIDYTCQNRCVGAGYSHAYCEDKCSYGPSPTYVVPTPPVQRRGVDPNIAAGSPDRGAAALEATQRGRENKRQEEQLRIQREQLELQRQQMQFQRQQPYQSTYQSTDESTCMMPCQKAGNSYGACQRRCANGKPYGSAQAPQQSDSAESLYDQLVKLDELRKKGILTDAEFEQQKQKILNPK
jgi:Fe-S-cluster containining protein